MNKYSTPLLSGIRFNCPVSLPRIEMEQINIGNSNVVTGFATGVNIGSANSIFSDRRKEVYALTLLTGITGLGVGQTPFTGVTGTSLSLVGFREEDTIFNLGFNNLAEDSDEGYNLGGYNILRSSENIVQLGIDLHSLNLINSSIIGRNNTIYTGQNVLLIGNNNDVSNSAQALSIFGVNNNVDKYNGSILGNNNTLSLGRQSKANILGSSNNIKNADDLNVLGESNTVSGIDASYVLGKNNTIFSNGPSSNSDIFIFGEDNESLNSNGQILIGKNNTAQNTSENILIGKNIFSSAANTLSFGKENLIKGLNESVYGKLNIIDINSTNNLVVGLSNTLSGAERNTIIGSLNTSNSELLNSIYLQELTGITGLGVGQTPFTGITGRLIRGGYSGLNPVGGASNFFVGDRNQGTLNTSSYILGKNNRLLNNTNANVVGASNYLEGTVDSYVFGKNNSISGFENYVIGHGNIIRSGDYNNIVIGISHEITGESKVASINIGVVNSSIEINPSEIKLNTSNKAKINDEDIIVRSDLNPYLTNSNGLQNDGIFLTDTFKNSDLVGYPSTIKLAPFSYSGQEDRYFTSFTITGYFEDIGNISSGFNGFFRKQPIQYYQGQATSREGEFFLQSNDKNLNALFTKDLEPQTGYWTIIDNTYQVFFTNPSTDTGIFPTSNWKSYGEEDGIYTFSGLSPAPEFTYNGGNFTGYFEEEIIEGTSSPANFNYFVSFAERSYTSSQGISIIYGNHTDAQFDPTWLIIDNTSSGLYYRNDSKNSEALPQTGWVVTGYFGYSGRSEPESEEVLGGTKGIDVVINARKTGFVSSYSDQYGTIYIPFYY